jgi:Tfp pilus assembly protein PilV
MQRTGRRSRGVSLVEAMVALAVMAFGTLAVLGVQTTLRLNADIAKQRYEAVRIAQEAIEVARAFPDLDTYEAFGSTEPETVTSDTANTSYLLTRTVTDAEADPSSPRRKTFVVDVSWVDRSGQGQAVRLSTALHGTPPALAGSLSVPGDAAYTRNPRGRHSAVPPGAFDMGDGTSRFEVPSSGGVSWTFDNLSGYITNTCLSDACTPINARLLSGFVRFATVDWAPPDASDAEFPPGFVRLVDVVVDQTKPVGRVGRLPCYEKLESAYVAYYCAVPIDTAPSWSGRSRVLVSPLATSVTDNDASRFRVCRYTPYRGRHPVVPGEMTNEEHPLDYVNVTRSLMNQNFLVIRAGNGFGAAFVCPPDDPATFIDTNTWHHQPAS